MAGQSAKNNPVAKVSNSWSKLSDTKLYNEETGEVKDIEDFKNAT